jgi:hypothetical protein
MSNMQPEGGGKFGAPPRVVRTSEVEHPLAQVKRRMRELGATDEMIGDAVDAHERGRINLREMPDEDLAARVAALSEGTDVVWAEADRSRIEEARRDPELWAQINTDQMADGKVGVIGQTVGTVMKWVGLDAGKAVLAHYAELERAAEENRSPRRSLVALLRGIHGQGDLIPLTEG